MTRQNEFNAHQALSSVARPVAGANWTKPVPVRARRQGVAVRLIASVLASIVLSACGGGSADEPTKASHVKCHPDTLDCEQMYSKEYAHLFVVLPSELYVYSDDAPISAVLDQVSSDGRIMRIEMIR